VEPLLSLPSPSSHLTFSPTQDPNRTSWERIHTQRTSISNVVRWINFTQPLTRRRGPTHGRRQFHADISLACGRSSPPNGNIINNIGRLLGLLSESMKLSHCLFSRRSRLGKSNLSGEKVRQFIDLKTLATQLLQLTPHRSVCLSVCQLNQTGPSRCWR